MIRYKKIFEMNTDTNQSIVIKKEDKMVFLDWFNLIWQGNFAHIKGMKEIGNFLYFSLDLNLHNMYLIKDSFKSDTGLYVEVK